MQSDNQNTPIMPRKFWLILGVLALILTVVVAWQLLAHHQSKSTSVNAPDNQALLALKWDGTLDGDLVHVNQDKASFTDQELKEQFPSEGTKLRPVDGLAISPLDNEGRSQQANFTASSASLKQVTKRPARIANDVRPSGWNINDTYNGQRWVGGYHDNPQVYLGGSNQALWNKSHLVGYQFFGMPTMSTENMITGTRVENAYPGQLVPEDDIRYALKQNPNVTIRGQVTPLYQGNDRIARGVHYMAKSVEDNGRTLNLNYWIFNVQPGIVINYQTGQVQIQDSAKVRSTEKARQVAVLFLCLS